MFPKEISVPKEAATYNIDERWLSRVAPNEKLLCDGCFDLFHFGHANAFRQAKDFGGTLVAAVHTDEEIARAKGSKTVYPLSERIKILKSIRWVDQILPDAPYSFTVEDLRTLKVDYTVHGDDISLGADGRDCHEDIKAGGMFKIIRRTRGVSSTEILAALLDLVSSSPSPYLSDTNNTLLNRDLYQSSECILDPNYAKTLEVAHNLWCASSIYGPKITPVKLSKLNVGMNIANGAFNETISKSHYRRPRITYVCGSFDLFHAGTAAFLEDAKAFSDYLIVGIFSTELLRHVLGAKFPLLSLEQRAMCVSACKYVDEVLINAPLDTSQDLVDSFAINSIAVSSEGRDPQSRAALLEYGVNSTVNLTGTTTKIIQSSLPTNFDSIISRLARNQSALTKICSSKQSKTIRLELPGNANFFLNTDLKL